MSNFICLLYMLVAYITDCNAHMHTHTHTHTHMCMCMSQVPERL